MDEALIAAHPIAFIISTLAGIAYSIVFLFFIAHLLGIYREPTQSELTAEFVRLRDEVSMDAAVAFARKPMSHIWFGKVKQ